MKKHLITLAIAGAAMFSANGAFAQSASTSSNVAAHIVTPIAIVNNRALEFGSVINSTGGGTVVLSAAASTSSSTTGGIQLTSQGAAKASAKFTVTGETDYTYTLDLPSTDQDLANGSDHMSLNTFTSSLNGNPGTLTSGSEIVYVGATLNVPSGAPAGDYSGSFDVTVTYQ